MKKQLERNKEIENRRAEYKLKREIEVKNSPEFHGFKLDDRVITLVPKKDIGFIHTGTMPAGITGWIDDFLDDGQIMVDFDYEFNGQAAEPFLPNEIENSYICKQRKMI